MAGGLPGVGISGVFFVAVGLAMPFVELTRVLSGRSAGDRWPWIIRHFLVALSIVAIVFGTFVLLGQMFETTEVLESGALTTETVRTSPVRSVSLPALAVIMGLILALPLMQRFLVRFQTSQGGAV